MLELDPAHLTRYRIGTRTADLLICSRCGCYVGAMMDDNGNQYGTMIVFDAESADEVWNWIRKEPFYCAGVYETMAVRKWNLVIGAIADAAK